MSEFSKWIFERETRLSINVIKLQVMIGLFLFNKFVIEKEQGEVNDYFKREIKTWAKAKGFNLSVEEHEKPITIKGHDYYQLDATKKYKRMVFSK